VAEIVLVRHAPTTWSGRRYCGRSDPPLNAEGRRAATILADELAALFLPEPRVVSSPALRARQTAVAIGAAINQPQLEIDPRWQEVDFGIAEGCTFDELVALAPDVATRILAGEVALDWPGGETAVDFEARVLDALASAAVDGTMIVVTHAGPIRLVLARATGRRAPDIEVPAPASIVRLPRALPGTKRTPVIPSRA
jgi:probable phosphoglycerate mutase